jgi:small subunit ribosomal protein S21
MPTIKPQEGEPLEATLKKFKRQCMQAGILSEVKKREYYDKPSVRRKKKEEAARKKRAKALKRRGR